MDGDMDFGDGGEKKNKFSLKRVKVSWAEHELNSEWIHPIVLVSLLLLFYLPLQIVQDSALVVGSVYGCTALTMVLLVSVLVMGSPWTLTARSCFPLIRVLIYALVAFLLALRFVLLLATSDGNTCDEDFYSYIPNVPPYDSDLAATNTTAPLIEFCVGWKADTIMATAAHLFFNFLWFIFVFVFEVRAFREALVGIFSDWDASRYGSRVGVVLVGCMVFTYDIISFVWAIRLRDSFQTAFGDDNIYQVHCGIGGITVILYFVAWISAIFIALLPFISNEILPLGAQLLPLIAAIVNSVANILITIGLFIEPPVYGETENVGFEYTEFSQVVLVLAVVLVNILTTFWNYKYASSPPVQDDETGDIREVNG
jgi:hypothetical protein